MRLIKSTKTFLFLVTFIVLTSCTNTDKSSTIPMIDFANDLQVGYDVPLSSIASSVEYIPLETADGALLGNSLLIEATDSHIFVCDPQNDGNCKVFNRKGEYLRSIGQKGRGPGELNGIRGLQVCDDVVMMYDQQKIIVFNLDGEILNNIDLKELLGINADRIIMLGKNEFCISWLNREIPAPMLAVYRDNEFVFKHAYPQKEKLDLQEFTIGGQVFLNMKGHSMLMLTQYDEQIRVFSSVVDTIYSFSPEFEKTPAFALDYGKYALLLDYSNTNESIKVANLPMIETSRSLFMRPIFPAEGFTYRGSTRVGYAVYDKKEEKLMGLKYNAEYDTFGLVNDFDGAGAFWPAAVYNNELYQAVEAVKFIEWSEISASEKMKQVASTITEESNPVLVVAKLKE